MDQIFRLLQEYKNMGKYLPRLELYADGSGRVSAWEHLNDPDDRHTVESFNDFTSFLERIDVLYPVE